ncbi:MAG: DsbA family protein [Mucilaginibacter sp.]|nr:DsbA family protein [Mucilaginibacter sp.]
MKYTLVPPVTDKDHTFGDPNAGIELVEYGDFECPSCGEAFPVVKELQRELGSRLKFTFRNFPLRDVHVHAFTAAVAAEAAGLQGKYWQMHDIIFENQRNLTTNSLIGYAGRLGLDTLQVEAELSNNSLEDKVLADIESGLRSGVRGTPTFYINGEKYGDDWRDAASFLEYMAEARRMPD